jgi:hypothetical protein
MLHKDKETGEEYVYGYIYGFYPVKLIIKNKSIEDVLDEWTFVNIILSPFFYIMAWLYGTLFPLFVRLANPDFEEGEDEPLFPIRIPKKYRQDINQY